MKILFNAYSDFRSDGSSVATYGGPRNFTRSFIQAFAKKGHNLVGITISGKKEKNARVAVVRRHEPTHELLHVTLRLDSKAVLHARRPVMPKTVHAPIEGLTAVLREEKPDLLFLNGFSIANWYLLKAAHRAGIPVIAVHHGLWFKEASNASRTVTRSAISLMRKMEKDISRYATHEVFLNAFSRTEYQRGLGVKVSSKRASIIPLPTRFELPRLASKKKITGKDPLRIGMVGRWDPIKNIPAFYALAEAAHRAGKPWQFFLVCEVIENKELAPLRRLLQPHLTILPPMAPGPLRSFYRRMDLLVLPSHFDVSPSVVAEALLQKKMTLISPNVGWVSEYQQFDCNRWVTSFSDPDAVVRRISSMRTTLAPMPLVRYVQRVHHPDFVFGRYERLFHSVITSA